MMLLAAAAAATAGPAFAQSNASPGATPAPTTPQTAPPSAANTAASPAQLSQAAQTWANKTAMIGGASLQMADTAMQKAEHPRVKEFAKFEHDEQTAAAQVLKSIDANLSPPNPPQDVTTALDRLKQLRPGPAFDREFVSAQIQGHETLRGVQEDYLKAGRNPQATDSAKLLLTMINEHLTLLSDLRRDRLAAL
jgi:predicted outer membrane protein